MIFTDRGLFFEKKSLKINSAWALEYKFSSDRMSNSRVDKNKDEILGASAVLKYFARVSITSCCCALAVDIEYKRETKINISFVLMIFVTMLKLCHYSNILHFFKQHVYICMWKIKKQYS